MRKTRGKGRRKDDLAPIRAKGTFSTMGVVKKRERRGPHVGEGDVDMGTVKERRSSWDRLR